MNPTSPDWIPEHDLPEGQLFFSLPFLAQHWKCSEENVQRLIDDGSIRTAIDFAPGSSTKAMLRIPRRAVVDFLNSRKGGK
jgi:hypothetical protein